MKHAVILAHPRQQSFARWMCDAYCAAAVAGGHLVEEFDLYCMKFDPCLAADEMPTSPQGVPRADVLELRARLSTVDVFVLVYPVWFGGPPAIMKGFIDRVFTTGFGYESIMGGGLMPLLKGRKLISVTSTGSENAWLVDSGGWDAMRAAFDRRVAGACGLEVLEHLNFGGVDAELDPSKLEEAALGVRKLFADLF